MKNGLKNNFRKFSYEKRKVNSVLGTFKKSLDEVKDVLDSKKKTKEK